MLQLKTRAKINLPNREIRSPYIDSDPAVKLGQGRVKLVWWDRFAFDWASKGNKTAADTNGKQKGFAGNLGVILFFHGSKSQKTGNKLCQRDSLDAKNRFLRVLTIPA